MGTSAAKVAGGALGGTALSAVYMVIMGILAMQIEGLSAGALFNLNNTLTQVIEPTVPWLPALGVALVSGLTLYLIVRASSRWAKPVRLAFGAGFAALTAGLVVYSLFAIAPRHVEAVQRLEMHEGVPSWIDKGGSNSATHLVLLIVIAWLATHWRHEH